jgi:hypothetical protein
VLALLVLDLDDETRRDVGDANGESVVLTDWPPGPDERLTSIRRSFSSSIATSTSSASGMTTTVAVDVCVRPLDSVAGTRWTRWTPPSNFSRL